jgi:hypothetical protein
MKQLKVAKLDAEVVKMIEAEYTIVYTVFKTGYVLVIVK